MATALRRTAPAKLQALAAAGLRTPIGTDLVLHDRPDPEAIVLDGRRLAGVVVEAAQRYRTPLAILLMDLRLEKADLLRILRPDVVRTDAVALAGRGAAEDDEPLAAAARRTLLLAEIFVRRAVEAQIAAGAAAVIVCEPAASAVFVSPRQMSAGSPVFDCFVVEPLVRLRALLDRSGVCLFLHDCGEATTAMVAALAGRVRPAVLSLGSSRRLGDDAAVVPEDVVLFGNLPTKHFYSDSTMPLERVREATRQLVARMREAGRPFILGSECDVLHVPDAAATIRRKVEAMLTEAG